ncbi:MAG: hypothetical protein GVY14_10380 [Spirochaetes bacterium]|nr:hypothetical protein [Spirochaetota bacterium]
MPGVPLLAGFVGLLCVTAPMLLPGQAASTGAEAGRYEYRYRVPTGTSVDVLSDEPEVLEFGIAEDPAFSEAGVVSVIEYHGVYPLSVEELRSAITAYEEYTVISRRVVASEGRPAPEERPYEPIGTVIERQAALMRTSFKFLFFGRDYDYVLSSMTEELPGDAILVRSAMTESLDGGLSAIHYSWYLEPLGNGAAGGGGSGKRGNAATYLRYFARVDFAEEPNGLRLALELFARSDVERLLESVYRYARTGR